MTTIQQTAWELLPVGEYLAVVTDVKLVDGMFGQQCEFVFTLEGGEFDGIFVKGWTSARFSARSKLFKWAQAAFGGAEIPPDYDLDLNHLVGQRVNLLVTIRTKDDGGEVNRIDGLRTYHPPRPAGASGRPGAAANGRPGAMPGPGAAAGGPGVFPPAPPDPPDDIPF